jgi:vesicle transport through interaction with t-SNAREs protein 1
MFSSYESEFTRACIDANAHVSALEQLLPGIERDAAKRQAEKAVDAAAEVVSQLEMEAGPADRARVRECRATLGQLRAKFAAARSTTRVAELQREELMRRADEPQRIEAEQQHTRLLETTSRMQRGTDKLRQACQVRRAPPVAFTPGPNHAATRLHQILPAHPRPAKAEHPPVALMLSACAQVAIETETVGASILTDLDQQRMTLEQTRERLRNANRGLAKSKKLLQSMTKRAWANKVLMVRPCICTHMPCPPALPPF